MSPSPILRFPAVRVPVGNLAHATSQTSILHNAHLPALSLQTKGLAATILLASTLATTSLMANLAYDEGVSGDLSNLQNAPDPVSFVASNNLVYGTTENAAIRD